MVALLRFFVSMVTFASSLGHGAENRQQQITDEDIVLQAESTLVITAWKGSARCDEGMIYLQQPAAKAVPPYVLPTRRPLIFGSYVIFDHLPEKRETIVLGPYHDDTKIVFAFQFLGDCNDSFPHTSARVLVTKYSQEHWAFDVEDNKDNDHNDLHLELIIKPQPNSINDSITAVQAFNTPASYKYPWCGSQSAHVMTKPTEGHHIGRAYDFGMKKGQEICASEKGIVLWVEDSLGPGGNNITLLSRVNVVIIQTEEGVNQNYLHLQQDSVGEAGIHVGDVVEQGQVIGKVGNSGYVRPITGDGSHLHIEWVHNCYDLEKAREMRGKYRVGKPTLAWSCANFPSNTPFNFK